MSTRKPSHPRLVALALGALFVLAAGPVLAVAPPERKPAVLALRMNARGELVVAGVGALASEKEIAAYLRAEATLARLRARRGQRTRVVLVAHKDAPAAAAGKVVLLCRASGLRFGHGRPSEPDLTNTDIGLDDKVPLNYNLDRIEDFSVPGKVDPAAPVGIKPGPEPSPLDIPPPPGVGPDRPPLGVPPPPGVGPGLFARPDLFSGRVGAARLKLLREGGGSALSEAAVAEGLKWLALHQANDGHWGLHDFNKHARTAPFPEGRVVGDKSSPGTSRRNDTAGTAFGLLPFLAAGITHKPAPEGKRRAVDYHKTVRAGLLWLVARQSKAGANRGYYGGDAYAHGLATIAMCEAYALTSDPALKASAQAAINYMVYAQGPDGGWRYGPKMAGDTSVTGWYLTALKSGQLAGLSVPRVTLDKVYRFLDSVETARNSGGYGYVPKSPETYTMTAVGLLCRQYLGANPRNPGLRAGLMKLKKTAPGSTGNIYYEYYATQVMHHMGGENWKFWNLGVDDTGKQVHKGIRDSLISRQDKGAANADNKGTWAGTDHVGGRLGATSLSLLTLEVYYRHLPLYRRDPLPEGK